MKTITVKISESACQKLKGYRFGRKVNFIPRNPGDAMIDLVLAAADPDSLSAEALVTLEALGIQKAVR